MSWWALLPGVYVAASIALLCGFVRDIRRDLRRGKKRKP